MRFFSPRFTVILRISVVAGSIGERILLVGDNRSEKHNKKENKYTDKKKEKRRRTKKDKRLVVVKELIQHTIGG